MTQRHEVSKHCGENGADRLACHWDAPDLQLVKNKVSVRHNKAKHNEISYACAVNLFHVSSVKLLGIEISIF